MLIARLMASFFLAVGFVLLITESGCTAAQPLGAKAVNVADDQKPKPDEKPAKDQPQKPDQAGAVSSSAKNLKRIGIALHNYHDQMGRFPTAANYDKNGKPLLSWRVHIL